MTSLAPERKSITRYRPRRQCHVSDVTQVWTEDRETLPEFLKDKGVSKELWQSTHDDVVSHYKSYYNCCNAFWFNIFWFIFLPLLTLPIFFCYRANFESGWVVVMSKHAAEYKKCEIGVTFSRRSRRRRGRLRPGAASRWKWS